MSVKYYHELVILHNSMLIWLNVCVYFINADTWYMTSLVQVRNSSFPSAGALTRHNTSYNI